METFINRNVPASSCFKVNKWHEMKNISIVKRQRGWLTVQSISCPQVTHMLQFSYEKHIFISLYLSVPVAPHIV